MWHGYHSKIPKTQKYTLGQRIDNLFVEIIEAILTGSFSLKDEKLPHVKLAVRKTDVLKFLLLIIWESQSLDNKKYINLSIKIGEIGKMLGDWHNNIVKQNSPKK